MLDMAIRLENPGPGLQQKVLNTLYGLTTQMGPSLGGATPEPTFNYRQIAESLRVVIADLGVRRLFVILDEWAQVPTSAQPYLAEYIKRAIMTIPAVCIKLLARELPMPVI